MWLEVKQLDPPPSREQMDFAWQELTKRLSKFSGRCRVDAWVSPALREKHIKRAVGLLEYEVKSGLKEDEELFVAVPCGELEKGIVQLRWTMEGERRVRLVSTRSQKGLYGCPSAFGPNRWSENLTIDDAGSSRELPAFKVLDARGPAQICLHIGTADGLDRVLASLGNAEAQDVKTVAKLRDAIENANGQHKNAQLYRQLPCITVIYFDELDGGSADDLLRACLGDLTIAIDPQTTQIGKSFYGDNGVFRPEKNTATSAVIYRSRNRPSTSIVNPWARITVPQRWLDGTIFSVTDDGDVIAAEESPLA
jgi:hypothetical protein